MESNALRSLIIDALARPVGDSLIRPGLREALRMVDAGTVYALGSSGETPVDPELKPCLVIPLTRPVVVTDADREDAEAALKAYWETNNVGQQAISTCAHALAANRAKREQ